VAASAAWSFLLLASLRHADVAQQCQVPEVLKTEGLNVAGRTWGSVETTATSSFVCAVEFFNL